MIEVEVSKSLMFGRNQVGTRADPWGTPALIGFRYIISEGYRNREAKAFEYQEQ